MPTATDEFTNSIRVLRGIGLFSELQEGDLTLIAKKMEAIPLAPQTQILTQNTDADAVYFLIEGTVQILVNGEMVAQVDTVQCFGEMSCLVPGTPASASVLTAKDCHFLKINRQDFIDVVEKIPQLWKTLFLQMNGRFKAVNRRLSEVLEHTPQGLVKVDSKGMITNEYSIHCTHYFGKENLAGLGFAALIHPENTQAQELWVQTYPLLFDESGTLTFQDIADLLDKELTFRREDGTEKVFVFSYYPCRGVSGNIEAIDIGIEDVTEARELERQNSVMLSEQATLGKIYDNPESFLNFKAFIVSTLSTSVKYLREINAGSIAFESESTQDTLRKLHSLKGYSGVFALKPVQEAVHSLEEKLKDVGANGSRLKELIPALLTLKEAYTYTTDLYSRIGENLKKRLSGVAFSSEEFSQLKTFAQNKDFDGILRLSESLEKMNALKWVQNWPEEAVRIASQFGKDVEVSIEGDGGLISKRMYEDLDSVWIQLLRNAIAHGIETPEQRKESGKETTGKVRVVVDVSDTEVKFEVHDDGAGIAFDQLADLALSQENLNPAQIEQFVSQGEPWRILFLSGFTSATEVSELSGRGMGLSALKTVVESYHGSIHVESQPGRTLFRFLIPLSEARP